ncbi:MAG: TonB-dependent receptor plug domain-containing protein [Gammaproteobacteria bacterium]|nr:TonB-dependent receptor plug domain-containing protein [Gammaproteobacteria bacterium]
MIQFFRNTVVGLSLFAPLGVYAEQDLLAMSLSEFDLPEFNEYSVPVVLTATRLQQHQADVPASVTILDEHFIKQVGAQNLADLFRYVPGMMIGPDNNNNADAVHYHGGPAALPKNLQVLINGRSMYRAGLAAVSWFELPVALEDIKRIEVVRGPNSASYGSNAFQAVVNILTKHPADTYGSTASLKTGNNGEQDVYLRHGARLGKSDYRVSFTQKQNDGFAVDNDDRVSRFVDAEHYYQDAKLGEFETSIIVLDAKKQLADQMAFQTNENEISEQRMEVGSRWTKDLSPKHQLQVSGYVTQYRQKQKVRVSDVPVAYLDDDLRELYRNNDLLVSGNTNAVDVFKQQVEGGSPADALTYYSSLSAAEKSQLGFVNIYSLGQLSLVDDYLTAYDATYGINQVEDSLINSFRANYDTNIGSPDLLNGEINADLDEYRFDIEVQSTFIYSPELTLISGASFRRDEVDSHTYFNGRLTNDTNRVFASATWQASANMNLHLGVMAEQESDADLVFAPRAAMNYKLTPSQSVRLVYSESVRSPDLFEQDAYWQLTVENPQTNATLNGTTYYQTQQGPGNLDHQFIRSYEVGYYGRFIQFNSELDVRLFQENISDVFYQSLTLDELETVDDICMTFKGVEWQFSTDVWSQGQLRWNGAYVDADTDINNVNDEYRENVLLRIYAQNTHTLAWLQEWNANTFSSVSYILVDAYDDKNNDAGARTQIERLDMKVSHNFTIARNSLELSANLQHDISNDPYVLGDNVYEEETRVQVAARVNF